MAKEVISEERNAEGGRKAWNKTYYDKTVAKKEDGKSTQSFTDYLAGTGKKQLKLTLTLEEYEAIKAFCDENNTKPQDYIRQLIREDLGLRCLED